MARRTATWIWTRRTGSLLVATALLAGCGGLSQEEFAARAAAVCEDADRRAGTIEEPTNYETIVSAAEESAGILEDIRRRLAELQPPEDKQEAWDGYLRSLDATAAAFRDLHAAARREGGPAVQTAVSEGQTGARESIRRAQEAGVPGCADGVPGQ